jgi:GT2 family glycosyltransferase
MSNAVLSIVAGTYNRCDQVQRLVESVQRETKIPYILYITDAGSTDGTIEYLKSVESEIIRPIFVGKLLGQAKAYNDVFKQVDTPYVCWLSDDNEVVNHGLDTAVAILAKDRKIGMVGLKVRDKVGPFTKAPYIGGVSSIGILNVNQGVLPTKVMNAVGGFSEEFRDYGIDPDLTAKVLFHGYDVVYTRDVTIHHYRNWAEDKNTPEYKALQAKHDRFRTLYEQTYSRYSKPSRIWSLKKDLWEKIKTRLKDKHDFSVNSEKHVFGHLPRDYYNTVMAKHISLFDLIFSRNKPYHLRQRFRGPKPEMPAPTVNPAAQTGTADQSQAS